MKKRRASPPPDPGELGTKIQLREDARLIREGYWFDANEADRICHFFAVYCRHHKGELRGKPIILAPWQRMHLRRLFGWRRPTGIRRYEKSSWWVAKKNGKSTLAAGVGLFLLVADNEPGAEVYGLAGNLEQASIVFDDAKATVDASDTLNQMLNVYKRSIYWANKGARFNVLTGKPTGKHGFNPSGIIVDEVHEIQDRGAYDAITTGSVSRRQPLVFQISTAGDDLAGLGYSEYEYSKQCAEGVLENPHFLPVIYEADTKDDWRKPESWAKANPNLGISITTERLASLCKTAIDKPAEEPRFRQCHCNQWVSSVVRWIRPQTWARCAGPKLAVHKIIERLKGRTVYGGIDLSKTNDLSALVLVTEPADDDDVIEVAAFCWVPESAIDGRTRRDRVNYDRWCREGWIVATPGDVTDYRFIRKAINDLAADLEIREIGYDKVYATQVATELNEEDGIPMVEVRQGFLTLAGPTAELERRVLARTIRHFHNPVLAWNIHNCVVRRDHNANIMLDKMKAREKIDAAAALVNALSRAMLGDGASVYETEGITRL